MDHFSGCLLCGERLVHATEAAHRRCAVCGTGGMSEAACLAGHCVCDACHSLAGNERIEIPVSDNVLCGFSDRNAECLLADCPFHAEVSAG